MEEKIEIISSLIRLAIWLPLFIKLTSDIGGFLFTIDFLLIIFVKIYGEIGDNFIEAHHIKPISNMEDGEKTKIEDIVMLCSNCHSMMHRKKPWLTIEQLKKSIKRQQEQSNIN